MTTRTQPRTQPRDFCRNDTPQQCANARKHMGPSARNYGRDCDCGIADEDQAEYGFIPGDRIRCEDCGGYILVK